MYDDYFKNIIGGSIKSPEYYVSTYDNHTYQPRQVSALPGYSYTDDTNLKDNDIEDLYPDIYKIVSPMVDKLLTGKNFDSINEDMLVSWTVEIYDALEVDEDNTRLVNNNVAKTGNSVNNNGTNATNVRTAQRTVLPSTVINAGVNTASNPITNTTTNTSTNTTANKEPKVIDVANRYRNYKNPLLRDLIRILILNRLYGNRRPQGGGYMPRPYQAFGPTFMPVPDYSSVNTEIYKPYANYAKTYLDTPYPEE